MRKPKEHTSNDKPDEKLPRINTNRNESEDGFHDQQQADDSHETGQNNKVKKMAFWRRLKRKESQPVIANLVSIIAVIISGILAVFTYYLYHIASGQVESVVKAGNAAQSSAITAQNTLKETKRFNTKYLKIQTDAFNKANADATKRDKFDKENSGRQKQSISAQIASLNQTQKNFELTNRAYLQISVFDTVRLGNPYAIIAFLISNIGQQPAKIIDGYANMSLNIPGITDRKIIFNNSLEKWLPDNSYVITSAPVQKNVQLSGAVETGFMKKLKKGELSIYIFGKYNYVNIATNKKTRYEFYAELSLVNGKVWHMIQSDNIPTD